MNTAIIFVLLGVILLIVIVLSILLYMLVGVIQVQNDNNTYLLTRLFLKLGDYADLTMDDIDNTKRIIREDKVHELKKKPFSPHDELDKIDPPMEYDE